MKIDLADIDLENFIVKEGELCGEKAFLVGPKHIGTKWTQANSIFRSSIWNVDGGLISAGYKKFVNLFENPENFPIPESLEGAAIQLKIDGSCMICDWNHNQNKLSMRTRGTFSYQSLDNHKDFEFVVAKYPQIEDMCRFFGDLTVLFEIVSPNQRIVLDYGGEPDVYLIGIVDKRDYSLFTQKDLDAIGAAWRLKRPERFEYQSLDDLVEHIKGVEGIEGVCIYSDVDQIIHKVKSEYYLKLHRLKSELSNPARVLDWYVSAAMPDYESAKKLLAENFDFEILERVDADLIRCVELGEKARKELDKLEKLVIMVKELPSRKEQAAQIRQAAPDLMGVAFTLLDGKEIEEKHLKLIISKLDEPTNIL